MTFFLKKKNPNNKVIFPTYHIYFRTPSPPHPHPQKRKVHSFEFRLQIWLLSWRHFPVNLNCFLVSWGFHVGSLRRNLGLWLPHSAKYSHSCACISGAKWWGSKKEVKQWGFTLPFWDHSCSNLWERVPPSETGLLWAPHLHFWSDQEIACGPGCEKTEKTRKHKENYRTLPTLSDIRNSLSHSFLRQN